MFNLVCRIVRDPALAEDVAQEAFLKAFSHLSRFDPQFKFQSWILRIAHNAAIDALRRKAPRHEVSLESGAEEGLRLGDTLVDPSAEPHVRAVEHQELAQAMAAALERLRPEYREVVVLRHHEELSYDEISVVTGLPLGTVKSYLHRARAEMAAYLRRSGWA